MARKDFCPQYHTLNSTLKTYLEAVMKGISPDDSSKLIESEAKRLQELEKLEKIRANGWMVYMSLDLDIDMAEEIHLVAKAKSFADFKKRAESLYGAEKAQDLYKTLMDYPDARNDFNDLRPILGHPILRFSKATKK